MTSVWALAALWLGLAVVATLFSIWLRVSTALSEIAVGTIAQLILGLAFGPAVLGTGEPWVKFLAGIGAIVLTFLAGAELDPKVFKLKWKEVATVGLASFPFPFLGCAAAAHYWFGWEVMPSWLARGCMSTTSVAVVYAVMLEFGFNTTEYGKTILAACFVTAQQPCATASSANAGARQHAKEKRWVMAPSRLCPPPFSTGRRGRSSACVTPPALRRSDRSARRQGRAGSTIAACAAAAGR